MTEIRIELARPEDIPAMTALLADLFSIEQDLVPDLSRQAQGLALLLQEPRRATVRVARDATGEVLGMITAQLVISTAEGAPSAWIEDVVVAAHARGGGIGRHLLEAALAWASQQGATRAQLLVDLDNTTALGFYQHLGWQTTHFGMRRIPLARQGPNG